MSPIAPPNDHRHPDIHAVDLAPDYRYRRLTRDVTIRYGDGEFEYITVPRGFVWDGASVPWLFRRVVTQHGGRHQAAALLHDYLYSTGLYPREVADELFRRAMAYNGTSAAIVWPVYIGVRLGGWVAWRAHRRREAEADARRQQIQEPPHE